MKAGERVAAADNSCAACATQRNFGASYFREPPEKPDETGHGFAWICGAVHLLRLLRRGPSEPERPVVLALCEAHTSELEDLLHQSGIQLDEVAAVSIVTLGKSQVAS